jgi:Lrp/AsnC family leucine-responsive transcriptional regulator
MAKKLSLQELDLFDIRLLQALQDNGRLSNIELAERVRLSASQCQRRVKKLEELGIIRQYVALLDRDKIGLGVMAFVNVRLARHGDDPARVFQETIAREPHILECWAVTGEADYVLRVVATDLKAFSNFLLHTLLSVPVIAEVRSTVMLEQLKGSNVLPLEM